MVGEDLGTVVVEDRGRDRLGVVDRVELLGVVDRPESFGLEYFRYFELRVDLAGSGNPFTGRSL